MIKVKRRGRPPNPSKYLGQQATPQAGPSEPKRRLGRPPKKGLQPPTPASASEDRMDVDPEPTPVKRIGRPPGKSGRKSGRPPANQPPPTDSSEDEPAATPVRRPGRRAKEPSPVPLPRVRLRLPTLQKGKGKEREEEDQPQQGLFDEILSMDDRDTMKTMISKVDKTLFDKARETADVCIAAYRSVY